MRNGSNRKKQTGASPRKESRTLSFLYRTAPGRILLKPLTCRGVSRLCGAFLDSPLSRPLISRFARKNQIDLSDYTEREYPSFNAFFSRRIRPELRPIPEDPHALISPCDGLLSAYRIREGLVLPIKQSAYTVSGLLGGDAIAARYTDGVCLVFRLCVNHYHRYCYPDSGEKGDNIFLPGVLHTVRPIALEKFPVFLENCREYTVMETAHFGTVTQVEVGALLVGKIKNHQRAGSFSRGQEKGMFLYGGSTVVLLLEGERVELPDSVFRETAEGREVPVRMGQILGTAASTRQGNAAR